MQVSNAGPERFVLGVALLVPLMVAAVATAQLAGGPGIASPTGLFLSGVGAGVSVAARRPAPSRPEPPPTLVPPTATPRATATPVPTATPEPTATAVPTTTPVPTSTAVPATATPERGRTYTVRKGDELKHIAAEYHVNIFKLIAANDIPNPDSLRIGQVLRIPDEQ